jgi:hypothetical protein
MTRICVGNRPPTPHGKEYRVNGRWLLTTPEMIRQGAGEIRGTLRTRPQTARVTTGPVRQGQRDLTRLNVSRLWIVIVSNRLALRLI